MRRSSHLSKIIRHRPVLERLEPRLPPGDTILAWLLAGTAGSVDAEDFSDATTFESRSTDIPSLSIDTTTLNTPRSRRLGTSALPPDALNTEIEKAETSPPLDELPRRAGRASAPQSAATVNIAETSYPTTSNSSLARRANVTTPNPISPVFPPPVSPPREQGTPTKNFGKPSLTFEANHGQTDSRVDFITRTGDATVFLTPTAAVFSIQNSEPRIQNSEFEHASPLSPGGRGDGGEGDHSNGVAIHMQIVGGNPHAEPTGHHQQPGIVNYFIGNDPSQWRTHITTFSRVEYQDVYPGIDIAYYGASIDQPPDSNGQRTTNNGSNLEYDFIVAPGANPNAITLNFAGANSVEVNPLAGCCKTVR